MIGLRGKTIMLPGHAGIGPDFLGGLLCPALLFGLMAFAPWIDRTNRRARARSGSGLACLTYVPMLDVAAYYDTLGLSLDEMWVLSLAVPIVVGAGAFFMLRRTEPPPAKRFNPEGAADLFRRTANWARKRRN